MPPATIRERLPCRQSLSMPSATTHAAMYTIHPARHYPCRHPLSMVIHADRQYQYPCHHPLSMAIHATRQYQYPCHQTLIINIHVVNHATSHSVMPFSHIADHSTMSLSEESSRKLVCHATRLDESRGIHAAKVESSITFASKQTLHYMTLSRQMTPLASSPHHAANPPPTKSRDS